MRIERKRWVWQWIWMWVLFVLSIFLVLDFVETRYFSDLDKQTVRFYHLIRGGIGAALTSALAVWLLARQMKRVQLYHQAFRHSTDAIVLTDLSARIIEVNRAFVTLFGYSRSELIGQNMRIVKSRSSTPDFYKRMWESILRDGEWKGEIANRTKGGEEIPTWLSITPILDGKRKIGYMGVAIDLREKKKLEEELIRSERLAAMGKMSSLFAHEIKNPLGSISLNVELLEEELSPLAGGEIKRLLDAIMGEGERMAHITDAYLRFARFPKSALRPTTVEGVVNRLIEVIHGEAVRRRVKIVNRIASDLPALLLDGEQMHQALLNIARNSFDAMEKGGTLTFQVEREGETVSLTISDTGGGMTEEQRLHIFEPFFSTKAHGTGLGLTAALQVVEEHGGKIFCESAVGKGSRFVIQLPVQRKHFTRGRHENGAEKTEYSARRG